MRPRSLNPVSFRLPLASTLLIFAACSGAIALGGCANTVTDLTTGDCLKMPSDVDLSNDDDFSLTNVETVACDQEHDAEVIGEKVLEDGDYPGEDAVWDQAESFCMEAFSDYVGSDYSESSIEMRPLLPTEDSWNRVKDRTINCVGYLPGDKLSQTLKDSKR